MHPSPSVTQARIAEWEAALLAERAALATERQRTAQLEQERDVLKASHERLRLELELHKQRLFVAKAERVDTRQLELEFAQKLRALDEVAGTLGMAPGEASGDAGAKKKKRKPSGRRDLRSLPLQDKRVEIADPVFDALVTQGKAERIGFEESCKLAWQRGGMRRLVIARVKYRTVDEGGEAFLASAMTPPELFFRCLAAPSLLAHLVTGKYCEGLPQFRLEQRFARDGVPVDRGTMARWMEDVGATVGTTVVAAMRDEALATAFCIATDATGVAVQPVPVEGQRQACRRGHSFVKAEPEEKSPSFAATVEEPKKECTPRLDGAGLLRRTFALEVWACVRCGGRRRVLADLTAAYAFQPRRSLPLCHRSASRGFSSVSLATGWPGLRQ